MIEERKTAAISAAREIRNWIFLGVALVPAISAITYVLYHVNDTTIHLTHKQKFQIIQHVDPDSEDYKAHHLSFDDRVSIQEILRRIKRIEKELNIEEE